MKKTLILCLAFLLCLFNFPISAAGNELHWFFNKNDSHTQPSLAKEFSFLEDCGGLWLDREHNDASAEKVIYLTFDAGYINENVISILDTLKKHQAHATFFVLKHPIEAETDVIKRMFAEGHTVGNHTLHHKNMARVSDPDVVKEELCGLESLCLEKTGYALSHFYRPPEGSFTEEHLKAVKELGYTTVFWSFAYADWDNQKQPDQRAALKKLCDHVHNGEILLLHPTGATNAAILDDFLTKLENDGYRFGYLEDIKAGDLT